VCVGNDIVDLQSPRTEGRAADERFVARVFAEPERRTIQAAAEPDLELWCHWAAKEAGFKVISKLVGEPPPFVHRAFEVAWSEFEVAWSEAEEVVDHGGHAAPVRPDGGSVIRHGTVTWRERVAEVSVALQLGAVHAVASAVRARPAGFVRVLPRVALLDAPESPWAGALERLLPLFSAREVDAVYSRPSAAVRVGARGDLAAQMGVAESRLEIVCAPGPASQRPPRVLLDGEGTEADVSLSHDGRLIAWAVWIGTTSQEGMHRDRP
jgi:phosphopantetheinyl transferase (holo-ACP synthase)